MINLGTPVTVLTGSGLVSVGAAESESGLDNLVSLQIAEHQFLLSRGDAVTVGALLALASDTAEPAEQFSPPIGARS